MAVPLFYFGWKQINMLLNYTKFRRITRPRFATRKNLGHRVLRFALRLNLELVPWFAEIWIIPFFFWSKKRTMKLFMANNKTMYIIVGVETGSMYVQYVQVIQPNMPAHTTFKEIYSLFWSISVHVPIN